ncbi:MAG: hypothetical protein ACYC1T_02770 [Sulfuricaulis sp.]
MKTPALDDLKKTQPKTYERCLLDAFQLTPKCRPEVIEQLLFDVAWANHGILEEFRILQAVKKSAKIPLGLLRADLAEKRHLAGKLRYEFRDELKRVQK